MAALRFEREKLRSKCYVGVDGVEGFIDAPLAFAALTT